MIHLLIYANLEPKQKKLTFIGTYGVVTRREGASLSETAMQSHSTICVNDATTDERYSPSLDGLCSPATPFMAVPLRGRGGAVVGAILAARSSGTFINFFSCERLFTIVNL